MVKKLYIAGAELLESNRRDYGLYEIITTPRFGVALSVEPVFTRDTPEELADIIYKTYLNAKENVDIFPVGKKFLGNPSGFPDMGYIDRHPSEIYDFNLCDEDGLICYFELSDEEHTRLNNRLQALMKQ